MIVISDAEALNLERSRQRGVAMLREKNRYIANDATINEVLEKCEELNSVKNLLDGSATYLCDNEVTVLNDYACYNLDSLVKARFENVVTINSSVFNSCDNLICAYIPKATSIGAGSFSNCPRLQVAYFPSLTSSNWQFQNDNSVKKIIAPKCASTSTAQPFLYGAGNIELLDVALNNFTSIGGNGAKLQTVILRSDTVPTLSSSGLFSNPNTIFYIKQSLVSTLKNETNWSALPNINSRVVALEGSDYESEDWYESTDEYHLLFDE